MRLLDVMTEARLHSGCAVLPPTSLPRLRDDIETLPADLVTFYRSCGGATLFMGQAGEVQVLAPEDVIPANPVIAGDPGWDDPTSRSAYLVARTSSGEFVTVDLSVDRPDRVLDSFSELHGVVGSWPVIAPSFEAFLVSVWQTRGDHLYWAPRAAPSSCSSPTPMRSDDPLRPAMRPSAARSAPVAHSHRHSLECCSMRISAAERRNPSSGRRDQRHRPVPHGSC
ncbi:SMI1/KNR4 family protein [Clavibacter tessellarius]|nr:SMI1/KNR4 family protein [Clavibacter michiganensis]MBT1634184.1 SMI1/KNR4 family protein [Clavibacter michiganensis]UKF33009.1 SMI1/KNR4 family protein [Clavibacter michiganensis subsp. tessellarius]